MIGLIRDKVRPYQLSSATYYVLRESPEAIGSLCTMCSLDPERQSMRIGIRTFRGG